MYSGGLSDVGNVFCDLLVGRHFDAWHDQADKFARNGRFEEFAVVFAQLRNDAVELGIFYLWLYNRGMHEDVLHDRELGRRVFRLRLGELAVELHGNKERFS